MYNFSDNYIKNISDRNTTYWNRSCWSTTCTWGRSKNPAHLVYDVTDRGGHLSRGEVRLLVEWCSNWRETGGRGGGVEVWVDSPERYDEEKTKW